MFRLVAIISLRRNVLTSTVREKRLCTMKIFEKFFRKTIRIQAKEMKMKIFVQALEYSPDDSLFAADDLYPL